MTKVNRKKKTTSGRQTTGIAPVVCAALAYYFILIKGGTYDGPLSWPVLLAAHVILLAGTTILLVTLARTGKFKPAGTCLDLLLLVLFAWLVIGFLRAPFPRYSWNCLVSYTLLLSIFYLLLQFVDSRERVMLAARIIALGAVGVSAYACYGYFTGASVRASLPMGHHNFLGGYLVIASPVCLGICFVERVRSGDAYRRWLWMAGTALCYLTILATGSLGSMIATVVSSLFMALMLRRRPVGPSGRAGKKGGGRSWSLKRPWIFAGIAVIILLSCATLVLPFRDMCFRIRNILAGGLDLSIVSRMDIYKGALSGIAKRTLFGWGPGQTPFIFPLFRVQNPLTFVPGEIISQLHNTYLHLTFELGVIGLLLALAAPGCLIVLIIRRITKSRRGGRMPGNPMLPFFLTSIVGYSINAVTDFQLHLTAISLTLASVAALAVLSLHLDRPEDELNEDEKSGNTTNRRKSCRSILRGRIVIPILVLGAGMFVFACRLLFLDHRAQYHYYHATKGIEGTGSPRDIIEELELATKLDPSFGHYHFQFGYYGKWMGSRLAEQGHPGKSRSLLERAARDMETALGCNPNLPHYHVHLGGFLFQLKEHERAREILERARALDHFSPLPAFYLAMNHRALGRDEDAFREFERALMLLPRLATSTYWLEEENGLILNELLKMMKPSLDRMSSLKPRGHWVHGIAAKNDYFLEHIESMRKIPPDRLATMTLVQKDGLGDRPYYLYVYRRKGMLIESTPVVLVERWATQLPADHPAWYFFKERVTARELSGNRNRP